MAGTIAISNAEALVGDAVSQILRKGTPAVYGSATSNSGMHTGTLVIAMPVDQAPFSMLDTEGNPAGMFADLLRLWAEKTGENIELRGYKREESVSAIIIGEADIHAGLNSE